MDDRDSWMKTFVNKQRITFIDLLRTDSDFFIKLFPGLHDHTRDKLSCDFRNGGYLGANSNLLDCIVRIDSFASIFITFCNENNVALKLAGLMQSGLDTYNRTHGNLQRPQVQVYQNNIVRQGHEHPQGLHHPAPRDQVRISTDGDSGRQGATNSVDRPQPYIVDNGHMNEIMHVEDAVGENSEISDVAGRSVESREDSGHECTDVGLVGACNDAGQDLSNAAPQITCPCPHHANARGEENSHSVEHVFRESENEREVSNSVSDSDNIQRNESLSGRRYDILPSVNAFPVFDSNNIDRNDPIKKKSEGNKMTVTVENTTADVKNNAGVVNDTKSYGNETIDKRSQDHLLNHAGKIEILGDDRPISHMENSFFQNSPLERQNSDMNNTCQSEEDSSASFYLSSSDEDELLPAQNHELTELENLKETISPPVILKGSVHSCNSAEGAFGNLQFTIPKEVETTISSEASEGKFIRITTGLSGTQCQEDIEKYKSEVSNIENSGTKNGSGGTILTESLVNQTIAKEAINDPVRGNDKTCSTIPIFKYHNTISTVTAEKSDTDNQESAESDDTNTVRDFNDSVSSLTESSTSETELKQVEGIRMNKASEGVIQQQRSNENQNQYKSSDYLPVTFNHNNTVVKVIEAGEKPVQLKESGSSPLLINNAAVSTGSELSLVLDMHGRSGSDMLEIACCESDNGNDCASDHGFEDCFELHCPDSDSHDVLNLEASTSARQTNTDTQINTSNQIRSEDSLEHTLSYQNGLSDHNIHLQHINSGNDTSINEDIPNTRNYIGYLFSFAGRVIHNYFPELGVRF